MPIGARFIDAFTFGPGATSSTVVMHSPVDLSRCRVLKALLAVTAAASTGADSLDVKIQDTMDGTVWNTRGRFAAVLGTQATSPTEYARELLISANVDLQSGEKEYQVSGSQGGAELAAGTVLNGAFYPAYRGETGRHANWRVVFTVTNGSGTASFTAKVSLYGQDWNIN